MKTPYMDSSITIKLVCFCLFVFSVVGGGVFNYSLIHLFFCLFVVLLLLFVFNLFMYWFLYLIYLFIYLFMLLLLLLLLLLFLLLLCQP